MNNKHNPRGASTNTVSVEHALRAWLSHHQSSARASLQKMASEPLSSLMTSLVIGVALALPVGLFVAVENIKLLSGRWGDDPQISVYVRQGVSSASAVSLGEKLRSVSGVASAVYISPETALDEFKGYSGFGDALKLLDENPLPAVYIVKPINSDVELLTQLRQRLKSFPDVEDVELDLAWVTKLQQILNLAERFIVSFGLLLCMGVVLTIANTIRLTIENRREEIVVVKLVGGTDAYVRRPLLYSGLWFGLAGGIIAILLVLLLINLLTGPSLQLASLYQSSFLPKGPGLIDTLILLVASALMGLTGAWMATARHLSQTHPF